MEAVVHAGLEPQGDIVAVPAGVHPVLAAQQIDQRVGRALGLQGRGAIQAAAGSATMASQGLHSCCLFCYGYKKQIDFLWILI